ncbi:MAG: 50S ribosomal protein L3 [Deltaproteobacteria bacterium]|nr:50S ribosomal protein L3 [Deltaproteobacteria bacterium]
MVKGLIGKKLGMFQMFDESGHSLGVSVIQAGPCKVVQKKPNSKVQLGYGIAKESRLSKPVLGHYKKSGVPACEILREFPVENSDELEIGQEVRADIFNPGEIVKVIGVGKGKGFAGVIKRWNFSGGPEAHGSRSHRTPGSVGQCAWPSRIFKGKKMPGRMGGKSVTAPTVQVVEVRPEQNLLLVRGPIPGPRGSIVLIRKR